MTDKTPPLSKAELAEREKALWANELTWQRQNPRPDLSDFHRRLQQEIRRKKLLPLPTLDIAMWPEAVRCDIDVSDPEKFNDRFIELPKETRASGFEKGVIGAHNLFLLIVVFSFCIEKKPWSWWDPLVAYSPVAFFLWPLIYFCTFLIQKNTTSGGTRYNRQAQLVHVDDGMGRVAHIPWRQVIPFVSIGVAPASLMRLCAPLPHARLAYDRLLEIGRKDAESLRSLSASREPYGVPINMTDLDHVNLRRNLQRLEFLRRYMADGIQAIQPHPELLALGLVKKPEDYENPQNIRKVGWDGKYVFYPLDRALHYFSFGPWLDKRARARAEAFQWPQEVLDLCSPNADLSGLDIRPIKARTDVYYRPDGFTFTVLNRHGQTVPDLRDKHKAPWRKT